ncbi:hypothetical protein [Roseateles asaccharophilus]|uniref:Uncharacterized protein n=1 Tax=Roseateles asaccharophilus TaxID=582607 RepID=A0ABU2AEA8_9BURK|nr:hypothetical protein [Roseateles asaccharophilus]MDR7335543.1 hypothetical protein [Roseateles asaccharophilus]
MAALPVTIALTKIKCKIETDEVGSDEPYVLVTAVDLSNPVLPNAEVTLYGPWGGVDQGDTAVTQPIPQGIDPNDLPFIIWRRNAWGPSGQAKVIANPAQAIILVSMMEHDDGKASAARELAKAAVVSSLAASMGMTRAQRVAKLKADIHGALGIPTGAPNFDDRVGGTHEFALSASLLNVAAGPKNKTLTIVGDGGKYEVTLQVKKG